MSTGPLPAPRNAGAGPGVAPVMTTWGFIGSGNIGSTVARLAVAAGQYCVQITWRSLWGFHLAEASMELDASSGGSGNE